jgi:hypothetical protein
MTTTISGTAGVTYPSGGVDNVAGAGVGTTDTQTLTNKTLTSPTIDGTPVMGASVITRGTVNAGGANPLASGTVVDFTSIPSWVKRITVMMSGISTNGTSNLLIQAITGASTIVNTGYASSASNGANGATSTAGNIITAVVTAATLYNITATLVNVSGNTWLTTSIGGTNSSNAGNMGGGTVTLGAVLTGVRITSVTPDTFDAGSINILYE